MEEVSGGGGLDHADSEASPFEEYGAMAWSGFSATGDGAERYVLPDAEARAKAAVWLGRRLFVAGGES
ncbi:hypothetical protein DIPPA_32655 [Diplonema papillatum]|nr:hypothetical protein DIPPA_32655 [Diplonema papillatum]